MAWRDDLRPASFRGVPFEVESHNRTGGRKLAVHDYPFRDDPYAEDLGRKGPVFRVVGYVIGSDYMAKRDALIEALEAEDAGTLIHPYHGRKNVAADEYSSAETTREGGIARISITFIQTADNRFPSAAVDTQSAAEDTADSAKQSALDDFIDKFSTDGLPADLVEQVQAAVTSVVAPIMDISEDIVDLIQLPSDLAAVIYNGIQDLADALGDPARAINAYEALFNAGEDAEPVPQTTTTRKKQAAATESVYQLVRRGAAIEAARQAGRSEYENIDQALATLTRVVDGIELQAEAVETDGTPISDTIYSSLTSLRTVTVRDIHSRGTVLPRIISFTPMRTMPALLVAHRIYGDASREEEIVSRNNIRHPGFVPGGEALEILTDAA